MISPTELNCSHVALCSSPAVRGIWFPTDKVFMAAEQRARVLMEALCTLVTLSASLGNVPTGQSAQPVCSCDSHGRLHFCLFVSSPAYFLLRSYVCNSCEMSLTANSLCANRKREKRAAPFNTHKTCMLTRGSIFNAAFDVNECILSLLPHKWI